LRCFPEYIPAPYVRKWCRSWGTNLDDYYDWPNSEVRAFMKVYFEQCHGLNSGMPLWPITPNCSVRAFLRDPGTSWCPSHASAKLLTYQHRVMCSIHKVVCAYYFQIIVARTICLCKISIDSHLVIKLWEITLFMSRISGFLDLLGNLHGEGDSFDWSRDISISVSECNHSLCLIPSLTAVLWVSEQCGLANW
jgi:hypothetical protein